MRFHANQPISDAMADEIFRAARAMDAFAHVLIDDLSQQVRISGQLTKAQAISALNQAGCDASDIDVSDHVSGTSTCCGGCS